MGDRKLTPAACGVARGNNASPQAVRADITAISGWFVRICDRAFIALISPKQESNSYANFLDANRPELAEFPGEIRGNGRS